MGSLNNQKLLALCLACILFLTLATGCGKQTPEVQLPSDVPDAPIAEPEVPEKPADTPEEPAAPNPDEQPQEEVLPGTAESETVSINLGSGLYITDLGSYTGMYMEDGSDEILSNILMITVKNEGTQTLQYADIKLPVGEEEAQFSITTLPAGEQAVLLEKNRMAYSEKADRSTAVASNISFFEEPLSLHEDLLKLQIMNGIMNVTNVSDEDIDGDIVIYYKNSAAGLYYGGITYRVRVEGGLKAQEIRQVAGAHLSQTGSAVMFTTIE